MSGTRDASPGEDAQPCAQLPGRHNYIKAIICALTLKVNAISYLLDEVIDDVAEGAEDGKNQYTAGRIGQCNLVLI